MLHEDLEAGRGQASAHLSTCLPLRAPRMSPTVSTKTPSPLDGAGDTSKVLTPTLVTCAWGEKQLALPPLIALPQVAQNMDVYVSVACHPGHLCCSRGRRRAACVVGGGVHCVPEPRREEAPAGPGGVYGGGGASWDRKVIVYLVDTSREETDVWVLNVMADFPDELSPGL